MKLVRYSRGDFYGIGLVEGDEVIDLGLEAGQILDALDLPPPPRNAPRHALAHCMLWEPIRYPEKIFCVGVNYRDHMAETGRSPTQHPTIFTRFPDSLVSHEIAMQRPNASVQYDFEGELAVIIGKPGRDIKEADALQHVAGYSCFNDGTIRDWQNHTTQFTPGKNFPWTGSFGPWLVTPDEAPPVEEMTLTTRLNGVVVQQASCADLIFSVPQLIAYISSFTMLYPGTVISTGTPGGVGAKRTPPLWMKEGDVVEVEISGVGLLRNVVMDEG